MAMAIHGITTSSNSISKIISTIDEIAFQTNILALNAAVEAARAGEAGMGFAVVAEEVRSLAKRSADAAKETATMIEAAVTQSQRGVEVNSKVTASIAEVVQKANGVRDSLGHIVAKAREVDSVVSQITEASKEQNSGLEQINSAINLMNQVTQANAAGSEETASASEELTAQSMELRAGVDVLVKLVNGKSYAETRPKRVAETRESHAKADVPPVRSLEISPRKNRQPVATNGNGRGNGHAKGDLHDDSFFDM
jgi:methyl-accepting chemotaxis protein